MPLFTGENCDRAAVVVCHDDARRPPLPRSPIANPPQPVGTSITARENVPPREPRNSINLLFCAHETTISA